MIRDQPSDLEPAEVTDLLCQALVAKAEAVPAATVDGQRVVTSVAEINSIEMLLGSAGEIAPTNQWRAEIAERRNSVRQNHQRRYWPRYPRAQVVIASVILALVLAYGTFRPAEAANNVVIVLAALTLPAIWIAVAVSRSRKRRWEINAIRAGRSVPRSPAPRPALPEPPQGASRPGTSGGALALAGSALLLVSTFLPWASVGFGVSVDYWALADLHFIFEDDSTSTTFTGLLMGFLILWWSLYFFRPTASRRNWALGGMLPTILLCGIFSPAFDGLRGGDETGTAIATVAFLVVFIGNAVAIVQTLRGNKV